LGDTVFCAIRLGYHGHIGIPFFAMVGKKRRSRNARSRRLWVWGAFIIRKIGVRQNIQITSADLFAFPSKDTVSVLNESRRLQMLTISGNACLYAQASADAPGTG